MIKEIQTDRLTIRPYKTEDEKEVFKVINHFEIYKMTLNIPYPYPEEQVPIWLNFVQKNASYKKGFEYGIFHKEGYYLGNVGIVNIDYQHKGAEICYFIGYDYWGKGYATEAVKAMVRYGFKDLALERIQARCMVDNLGSRRVMEKCGFQYEGILRHSVLKDGEYLDVYQAAILKNDILMNEKVKTVHNNDEK